MKCTSFLELKKLDRLVEPDSRILDWVEGFIGGVNVVRLQQGLKTSVDIPNRKVLTKLIENECRKDPLDDVAMVSVKIVHYLVTTGRTTEMPAQSPRQQ